MKWPENKNEYCSAYFEINSWFPYPLTLLHVGLHPLCHVHHVINDVLSASISSSVVRSGLRVGPTYSGISGGGRGDRPLAETLPHPLSTPKWTYTLYRGLWEPPFWVQVTSLITPEPPPCRPLILKSLASGYAPVYTVYVTTRIPTMEIQLMTCKSDQWFTKAPHYSSKLVSD